MTDGFSPTWLTLREPADARARSADLAAALATELAADLTGAPSAGPAAGPAGRGTPPLVIRDLGCGTGSLGRWLSPRLPAPQHWILHDHDPVLLEHARGSLPEGVTAETRTGDATALTGDDLAGTSLVACSALLDLFTAAEVAGLAAACAVHRTPALFTLSVTGEVAFDPPHERDAEVAAAFNAHQRRETGGRRLLGPDAAPVAAAAFEKAGATVTLRPAPWRLASGDPLAAEWFAGWLAAAADQRPGLRLDDYRRWRAERPWTASVGHLDLLATFH